MLHCWAETPCDYTEPKFSSVVLPFPLEWNSPFYAVCACACLWAGNKVFQIALPRFYGKIITTCLNYGAPKNTRRTIHAENLWLGKPVFARFKAPCYIICIPSDQRAELWRGGADPELWATKPSKSNLFVGNITKLLAFLERLKPILPCSPEQHYLYWDLATTACRTTKMQLTGKSCVITTAWNFAALTT